MTDSQAPPTPDQVPDSIPAAPDAPVELAIDPNVVIQSLASKLASKEMAMSRLDAVIQALKNKLSEVIKENTRLKALTNRDSKPDKTTKPTPEESAPDKDE